MVADCLPDGVSIVIQSENGMIGMGPAPEAGREDRDLINAGGKHVTACKGASFFDSTIILLRRRIAGELPHAVVRESHQHTLSRQLALRINHADSRQISPCEWYRQYDRAIDYSLIQNSMKQIGLPVRFRPRSERGQHVSSCSHRLQYNSPVGSRSWRGAPDRSRRLNSHNRDGVRLKWLLFHLCQWA